MKSPDIAIIDHAHGNLLSVLRACEYFDLDATITSDPIEVARARAVILPGVGAFGEAMRVLRERDLISCLQDVASAGKPLIGICLGFQLLFSESEEFGLHQGLDVLPGRVVRLGKDLTLVDQERPLKIPQIGWNSVRLAEGAEGDAALLRGIAQDSSFYFLHSFYVRPGDQACVLGWTTYGDLRYCSIAAQDNVMGYQFHPERSGRIGLRIYSNLAQLVRR